MIRYVKYFFGRYNMWDFFMPSTSMCFTKKNFFEFRKSNKGPVTSLVKLLPLHVDPVTRDLRHTARFIAVNRVHSSECKPITTGLINDR